jgi:hypothetical protein
MDEYRSCVRTLAALPSSVLAVVASLQQMHAGHRPALRRGPHAAHPAPSAQLWTAQDDPAGELKEMAVAATGTGSMGCRVGSPSDHVPSRSSQPTVWLKLQGQGWGRCPASHRCAAMVHSEGVLRLASPGPAPTLYIQLPSVCSVALQPS